MSRRKKTSDAGHSVQYALILLAFFFAGEGCEECLVIQIACIVRLYFSCNIVAFYGFFQIPHPVMAYAQLHIGNVAVAVGLNKPIRCARNIPKGGQFIPEGGYFEVFLILEMFSDLAAYFRPGRVVLKRPEKGSQRFLLFPQ